MDNERIRRHIQSLKELPTLAPDLGRIIEVCEDPEVDFQHLSKVLQASPTITARLLGLANSAFFGQAGRVHTLEHATVVLGLPTVRSIATGLALAGAFRVDRCRSFDLERYWLTSILTAALGQELSGRVGSRLRLPAASVYLAGLLHNFGLLALVHLFPSSMDQAFRAYAEAPARGLAYHLRHFLDIDHYQAGAWLGGKWHLPQEVLLVMEHHHDPFYRQQQWPLVLLVGLCARWAAGALREVSSGGTIGGFAFGDSAVDLVIKSLEISPAAARQGQQAIMVQLPGYREMAATLAG